MEYFRDSMDLFQFIDEHPQMDEVLAKKIFKQLVEAVSYIHKKGICHRDIKEENVLINSSLQLRLIDFGSATFVEKGTKFCLFFGTLEYASPETLSGKSCTEFKLSSNSQVNPMTALKMTSGLSGLLFIA